MKTTREIIKKVILEQLLKEEKIDLKIRANICIGSRAHFTLKAKDRRSVNIKENELLIIRCIKDTTVYEYVGNTMVWGKINVPLEIIKELNIKNHETLSIEVIKNKPFSIDNSNNKIDLVKIDNAKVINRNNKYVTIYKNQQTPITLPRFIEIKPELIEALYLLHGDGRYKDKTFFTNVNLDLHKFIIKTFENSLGIPKNLWKARVNHCNRSLVEKSINFWSQELKINKDKFYNTKKLSRFNTKIYGDLRIIIDNLIVSKIIKYLIKNIELKQETRSLIALNGILDAEGSAQIGKKGLHKVTISFSQQEKAMFQEILKTSELDIFEIEQNSRFCIRNWGKKYIFIKAFLDNNLVPFNNHVERRFNTICGFLEHRYTKTLMKYTENIEGEKHQKELSEKMGHRVDSILDTVNKNRYKNFISLNNKIITITSKGKEFINIIKKLEILLKSTELEYKNYISPIEKFMQEVKNEQTTI